MTGNTWTARETFHYIRQHAASGSRRIVRGRFRDARHFLDMLRKWNIDGRWIYGPARDNEAPTESADHFHDS